ncbi:MAG: NAD-dependent epimerase/dehydratase family protein [Bacteroidota bacterium]
MDSTRKILLTGPTGFLGCPLAHALITAGHHVRGLVRSTSDTTALERLELVEGDLNDPNSLLDALEDIDTIVHTAALVSYQAGDRDRMLLVNGEGTANLVNMALEADVQRFIHLSSVAALGRTDGGPKTTLADRWPSERPNTSYAESKFAAEREVWRGQAEGLSVAVLNPSIILGPGDWFGQNTPAFWRQAAQERGIYPGGTSGFVDRRDVVEAVLFVLERDLDSDRFILNADNWSWRELLTEIAVSIGVRPPTRELAYWQSALLWPVEVLRARATGNKPLITRESHRNVQASFRYDGSAFAEARGKAYRPLAKTITEIGDVYRRGSSSSRHS